MLSFYAFLVHNQNLYMAFATNTCTCGSTQHTNIESTHAQYQHTRQNQMGSFFQTQAVRPVSAFNGAFSHWISFDRIRFSCIARSLTCSAVCMCASVVLMVNRSFSSMANPNVLPYWNLQFTSTFDSSVDWPNFPMSCHFNHGIFKILAKMHRIYRMIWNFQSEWTWNFD